ncbi:MAG: tRNA pseudouridine(38-40) synthase TruA [Candidatus Margulisbacteria bacterium]|jgi:tRNA pseudouridine38-40 synthase|nr:tRNA pseudouridine(38-40) synthase TruA [Candidatus Margulisiibacteriota bacterium]
MPPDLFLRLEYLGGLYAGSQAQKNGITIQELLDKALSRICGGAKIRTVFAGRTDSGVHSCGQAVTASLPAVMPAAKIQTALNSLLPPDIRVSAVSREAPVLGARYAAKSREYLYNIYCGEKPPLYLQHCVWHWPRTLDFALMRRAARLFRGEHDFSAFCAAGSAAVNKIRRVSVSDLSRHKIADWPGSGRRAAGELWTYRIKADGFLYRMARNIVAALVAVGSGRLTLQELRRIQLGNDRRCLAAPTAPAQGLTLYGVQY